MIKFSIRVRNTQEASEAQEQLFESNYVWKTEGLNKIEFYNFNDIKGDVFIHCFDNNVMMWSEDKLVNEQIIQFKDLTYTLPKPINIQDSLR